MIDRLKHSKVILWHIENTKKSLAAEKQAFPEADAIVKSELEVEVSHSPKFILISGKQNKFPNAESRYFILGKTVDGYCVVIHKPIKVLNGLSWLELEDLLDKEEED